MAGQNKYAGHVAQTSVPANVWLDPTNAEGAEDFVGYAACTVDLNDTDGAYSDYLDADTFGFTIPTAAQITGIIVNVYRYCSGGTGGVQDALVKLFKGGVIGGEDKSAGAFWDVADEIKTFGSASTLWGQTWTPADINGSGFGVRLQFVSPNFDTGAETGFVDAVQISVGYQLLQGPERIILMM